MTKDYKQLSRQLKAEEHILLRPNMYIGSTSLTEIEGYLLPDNVDKKISVGYVPGLLKLAYEILDNSVDIAIKTKFKYGNKISITVADDHCVVEDNGSGIPIQMVQDANGNEVWNPVLSWCYTMAGTNFDSDDEGRMSMGMNGVGSTVTSIFSKEFIGETHDGTNKLVVKTINNNKIDKVTVKPSTKNGTKVTFFPDFERFEVDSFTDDHKKIIRDRVYKLAACYPEISFVYNGEKISFKKMADIVPMIKEEYIIEKTDNVVVSLFENMNDDLDYISVVNGLSVIKGGSHVEYVTERIVAELRPIIEKKYKLNVLPAQIKQHLFVGIFMRNFPNMKFDSQTKEMITNSRKEVETFMEGLDFSKIAANMLKKADKYIMPIIEYQLMKQQQAEKRKMEAASKKALQESVAKHIAPLSKSNGNILYLVEGDSAKNNFQPTRNKDKHGMYPLRGKFMNVSKASVMDILQNNEAKEIMSILGLTIGKPVPDELRYGYSYIYLCADADVDGYCITTQLINFFALWPELFERGMIRVVHTPIMEIRKNNKITSVFYNLADYANYKVQPSEKIKYLKGLGSLGVNEYRDYLITNPRVDTVVMDDKAPEYLEIVFGNDADKRRDWLSS